MSPFFSCRTVHRLEIPLPPAAGFSRTLFSLAFVAMCAVPFGCDRASSAPATSAPAASAPAAAAPPASAPAQLVQQSAAPVTGIAKLPFKKLCDFRVSGEVAEIAAATPDGRTLAYTDSTSQEIGFVNIGDPAKPKQISTLKAGGEPTSVAITPNGKWLLCVVHGTPDQLLIVDVAKRTLLRKIALGGQPDCVAISANGRYAAIAIENERTDQDAPMPQTPPGFLAIVDLVGSPEAWKLRKVPLVGLADRFPGDPEPEFISINSKNEAAVTLQENNHVAIVNLVSAKLLRHWNVGVTSHAADLKSDGKVDFSDQLKAARREPDSIAWTPGGNLITANEGDYDLDLKPGEYSGGRNWTLFAPGGKVLYDDTGIEKAAAEAGLYKDKRSEKRGVEPEGAAVARFQERSLAFIGCERADCVAVYDITKEARPQLLQVLATGDKPEGLLPIPKRSLLITANEGDGTLSIFQYE